MNAHQRRVLRRWGDRKSRKNLPMEIILKEFTNGWRMSVNQVWTAMYYMPPTRLEVRQFNAMSFLKCKMRYPNSHEV